MRTIRKIITLAVTMALAVNQLVGVTSADEVNLPEQEELMLGDVTLNEVIDIKDLTCLARHVALIETLEGYKARLNADVDQSEGVDIKDLTKLARFVAEIENYDTQAVHTHSWTPVYSTVHHDEQVITAYKCSCGAEIQYNSGTEQPTVCTHNNAQIQYYTREVPAYDEPVTEAVTHTICKLCGVDEQEFIDAYNAKDAKKLNELYLVDTELVGYRDKQKIEENPNYLLDNFESGVRVFSRHNGGSWYQVTTIDTVGYKHHDSWTVSVYKGTYCPECDTWTEKYYIEDTCPEHPEWWLTDDFANDWNYQMGTNYTKQDLYIKMYIYKEKM